MKLKFRLPVIILASVAIFVVHTSFYEERYEYIPIFMERSELEKSVSYQAAGRELIQPGKIYHKAPYIYVNEKYKGVHIIDNSTPSNPQNVGFIVAPGCIDMAVKGNIMYLDNAVDLVAFDLANKKVTKRIAGIFPEPVSPNTFYYYNIESRPDNFVLVGWKKNPIKN